MLKVLNRFAWVLAITVWVSIFAIDEDLFFLWFIAIIGIKLILSEDFIKSHILEYNKKLEESILKKVASLWVYSEEKSQTTPIIPSETKDIIEENFLTSSWENEYIEANEVLSAEEYMKQYNKTESISPENPPTPEIPPAPSRFTKFFTEFFAENLIAKIGGILLALWVLFFMWLIYNAVWEVAKIIIGFALWFWIYSIGSIIEKKWYQTESMILLWSWILINYIVILWWRFIIGDSPEWYLWSGITFLLLLLNTIFSVVTAYIYQSKNLLLFSIIFAFILPFLTGSRNETPYIQVGYAFILSIWGLFISNYYQKQEEEKNAAEIFFISLIGANILFLTAPFGSFSEYFVLKMIGFNIVTFSFLFSTYKNQLSNFILPTFIISFTSLALMMFSGAALSSIWILVSFIIGVWGLLIGTSFFIIAWLWVGLLWILFLPIIFVLGFIFIAGAGSSIILLPLFLIAYLGVFILGIWGILTGGIKYIFFSVLWWFLAIGNFHFSMNIELTFLNTLIMTITAFLFLFSSYFLSSKKDFSYLYTIGTIGSIFILLPFIKITGEVAIISMIWVIIFWIANFFLPFCNKNLIKNDTLNLILGSIFWVIFVGGNLFAFWNEYFPGVSVGIWFLVLAISYFLGWYTLFQKLQKNETSEKTSEQNMNFIYTFLAIAISLFSLSIALVFAKTPAIVAMVWLFQSSILFFFANKLQKEKIYYAGIILFLIWLVKFWEYFWYLSHDLYLQINTTKPEEILKNGWFTINYIYHLIWVIFIGISLFINIIIFRKTKFKSTFGVNILHTIWILILWLNILYLFTDYIAEYLLYRNNFGIAYVIIGIIIWLLSSIYNLIWNKFQKYAVYIFMSLTVFTHIFTTQEFHNYSLNYLFTFIVWGVFALDYLSIKSWKISDFKNIFSQFWTVIGVYFFIITSIYLYHTTQDSFTLTMYWWALSMIFIHAGINLQKKKLRTIGLVLIVFTLTKIIFYDIWNSIDNGIIRVVAFMFVGWIMLYVNSLYTKNKLNIKDDFSFENDSWETKIKSWILSSKTPPEKIVSNSEIEATSDLINQKIKDIDVSNIESITFSPQNANVFQIKSKDLFKIVLLVLHNTKKQTFDAWELWEIYQYVLKNYQTNLSKTDFNKLTSVIKKFVDLWGNVEIKKK